MDGVEFPFAFLCLHLDSDVALRENFDREVDLLRDWTQERDRDRARHLEWQWDLCKALYFLCSATYSFAS